MKEETLTAVEIMNLADGKYAIYQRLDGSTFATRHNSYWRDLTGDHLIANLVQRIKDHEEADADRQRLVRELDIALNGESGAAKQASLCDIVGQAQALARKLPLPIAARQGNWHHPDGGRIVGWVIDPETMKLMGDEAFALPRELEECLGVMMSEARAKRPIEVRVNTKEAVKIINEFVAGVGVIVSTEGVPSGNVSDEQLKALLEEAIIQINRRNGWSDSDE